MQTEIFLTCTDPSIFFYFDLLLIYKPWEQLTEQRETDYIKGQTHFVPENSYITEHIYYDALGRNSNQLFPCTEFRENRVYSLIYNM